MFRLIFFFVFIVFLLCYVVVFKFEVFLNEVEYDVGDFYFKIFVENEDKGNIVFELQRILDVLVSGDGNSVGVMVNLFEFGLFYVKDVFFE